VTRSPFSERKARCVSFASREPSVSARDQTRTHTLNQRKRPISAVYDEGPATPALWDNFTLAVFLVCSVERPIHNSCGGREDMPDNVINGPGFNDGLIVV